MFVKEETTRNVLSQKQTPLRLSLKVSAQDSVTLKITDFLKVKTEFHLSEKNVDSALFIKFFPYPVTEAKNI